MQDPNADTEWNDALRKHGILPPKETEVTEEDLVELVEETIAEKMAGKKADDMTLEELDEIEDDEDAEILAQIRRARIAELKAMQKRARFGELMHLAASDYKREVNEAGEGVWVVLHLFQEQLVMSKLVNKHLAELAKKFPTTKFLKISSTDCIPGYPDKNLPTIFVYQNDGLKAQHAGPVAFGGTSCTQEDVEWMLKKAGAVESDMERNPRANEALNDALDAALRRQYGQE